MTTSDLQIRILPAIADISAQDWDSCANPVEVICAAGETIARSLSYNPFISHAFLSALEASGSVSARTGWQPQHLVAEQDDRIVGVVPCYLKSHSRGEYVFDAGWADAYERAGGS
jgi:predicted N-acyltransferase